MRGPTGTVLFRLALVVLALTGTACSDDPPKAGGLPSDTPSPTSSSASPTPATPEEQVEAAVRAYYAELTRAAQTNDTSKLKPMMAPGCPCYRAVRVIDRNAREGERTPDASFELKELRIHDVEGSTALAEVRTVESAYRVLGTDGGVVDRVAAQKTHLDLSLVRAEGDTWIIGNWFNLGGS
jgi:hypothetical protein